MILGLKVLFGINKVNKIVLGENKDSNPALVPGFHFSRNIIYL